MLAQAIARAATGGQAARAKELLGSALTLSVEKSEMYLKELEAIKSQLAVGTMALSHVLDTLKRLNKAPHTLQKAEYNLLKGCRDLDNAMEILKTDAASGE